MSISGPCLSTAYALLQGNYNATQQIIPVYCIECQVVQNISHHLHMLESFRYFSDHLSYLIFGNYGVRI